MRVITTSLFIGMAAAFVPTGMRPTLHRITPTTLPVAAPIAAPIKPVAPKAIRIAPPATMLTGLEGPGLVTAVWTLIALNFMPLGPTAALTEMSPGQQKWGDRTFMNMMEQAPIFFAALWSHAFFCSAKVATGLGMIYLGLRLCYPIIWLLLGGGGVGAPFPQIFLSTFPQYGIAFYLALGVVLKLGFGICLNTMVGFPLAGKPCSSGRAPEIDRPSA